MTNDRAARAAALLVEARQSGNGIAPFPAECRPTSLAEVYAIQNAVAERVGPVRAWKTGAPNPEAEPAYAPIFEVTPSPARFPAATQRLFGIEAELAFRFARDLPPRATPYSRDDVIAAISAMHPVIELVDSRFAEWSKIDALSKLADNQSNGALIYGAPIADWQGLEFVRPPITVTFDGAVAARSTGNSGGDPLRMVTALVNYCASSAGGIREGAFVTSGSITGVAFAKPGTVVVADFGPLGEVKLDFPI
jgi:2-keto-4-pentenoate hydratase